MARRDEHDDCEDADTDYDNDYYLVALHQGHDSLLNEVSLLHALVPGVSHRGNENVSPHERFFSNCGLSHLTVVTRTLAGESCDHHKLWQWL